MKIHYMEWDSHQVTTDATYIAWPTAQSAVSVIDD
jgi:hypothetical protein